MPSGSPPQCGRRVAVNRPAPVPGSGGVRCSTTPPWSSVRPRAPRVWLAPLPGPSRTRYVGEEGQVGWRSRVWRCPFPYCRRVAEVREVRPSSGGCGKRSLGSYLCPTPWAAKASLYSLGVRCACWAGGRRPRWCVRPTVGAVACCAAARCWVVRGVVLGEVCPVGVVVVRGRPRCRWRDGHRPALWWEEAVPGPPRRFFPARG